MSVDAGTAEWLKEGALYASIEDALAAAAWGADAVETKIVSPIALAADAQTEAARQLAFLKGPLALETHDVAGLRSDLLAKAVTIVGAQLGYDAGLTVFVIGVEEREGVERTKLTVLRRLA
jgi:hypothetical protein